MDANELKANIAIVKRRICAAQERGGRVGSVTIVGASKTMTQDVIDTVDSERLLEVLGENRAQELRDKYRDGQSFKWHFIGSLQANKIKYLAKKVVLIESVDSMEIASSLEDYAFKHSLIFDVLVQINMGNEPSKSGFKPEEVMEVIARLREFKRLKVCGVMAVMPMADNSSTIALYKELNVLWTNIREAYDDMEYLSAGMSNDYELAVEYAGSNIVRIGRAIFGERNIAY